jgi:DNA modification methylase
MDNVRNTIHCGEALALLKTLPDASVNTIVTSPPYYSVRDYGAEGQLGLEQTPELYIERLVAIFHEARRVLRDDGCVFVNLGDSYAGSGAGGGGNRKGNEHGQHDDMVGVGRPRGNGGIRAKSLIGIPARFALAMQRDGWTWRSNAPWIKDSALPESVTDRPTKTIEWIMLFVKSPKYWYDATAVRQSSGEQSIARAKRGVGETNGWVNGAPGQTPHSLHQPRAHDDGREVESTRNFRDTDFLHAALDAEIEATMLRLRALQALKRRGLVTDERGDPLLLHVNPEPSSLPHYAMYPTALVRPMILAGCPEKVCATCGTPWVRQVETESHYTKRQDRDQYNNMGMVDSSGWKPPTRSDKGFVPACTCAAPARPGLCLDPFGGTGTTGVVARELGRDYLLFDLSAEYCAIMEQRLGEPFNLPLLAQETAPDVEAQLSLFD